MDQFYYTYQNNAISIYHYIYRIGSYHYNWHKELELLTVLNGEVEVCVDGKAHILDPGDVILINSNKGHASLAKRPNSIAMVMHLSPELFPLYYDNVEFLQFSCCSAGGSAQEQPYVLLRAYLAEMMLSQSQQNAERKLRFESAFYSLLHTIVLYFPPEYLSSSTIMLLRSTFDAVEKIINYINRHYAQRITLNDLAKVSQYNRNYISQFFKSYLGINFHDYLTRIRLREATLELGQSTKSISEIALRHGFSDLKSFHTAFRASFGKTPTEYRRQLNQDITQHDLNFKKEFVPYEDETIRRILVQYIIDRDLLRGRKDSPNDTRQIAAETSLKLQELSDELKQSMDKLDNIIWTLSK